MPRFFAVEWIAANEERPQRVGDQLTGPGGRSPGEAEHRSRQTDIGLQRDDDELEPAEIAGAEGAFAKLIGLVLAAANIDFGDFHVAPQNLP